MENKWEIIEKNTGKIEVGFMAQYIYGRNVIVSRLKEAKDIEEVYVLDSFKERNILDLLKKMYK